MSSAEPTPEQLQKLAELPDDLPVIMVNLLEFKQPGGIESYARYGELVQPHLERVGARVLHSGGGGQTVIGEESGPWWDAIVVVRYPSAQAFLGMVSDPDYLSIHAHRAAALERAELIATFTPPRQPAGA